MLKWYKAALKLKAWSATAWQSDTIFGHLCWGLRYLESEQKLRDFLQMYRDGRPPLLLSNGFSGGLLPVPLSPPAKIADSIPLEKQVEQYHAVKKTKAIKFVPFAEFSELLQGKKITLPSESYSHVRVTLKNQVSRASGTTGEDGSLYNFEEHSWPDIDIYFKAEDSFFETAKKLFDYIASTGYGKRKSVGYGQVESLMIEPFAGFPHLEKANGFMTLSNFVPASDDPLRGSWSVLVKYGKLGEELAVRGNPFKQPLIMLEAGSAFYHSPCRDYYGGLIEGLSGSFPQAVHYAYALPVPAVLPGVE